MSLNGTVWAPRGHSPMGEGSRQDNGLVSAINPNDPHVLEATAHLLMNNSRYSEAISANQRLLDEYPNSNAEALCLHKSSRPCENSEP